jgi:hypothetical protein
MIEGRDMLSWQHGRHSLKFGGSFRRYIWPMWGFFQNRGYYQFTNGYTTMTATNDGTGSALASFLLGLPAVKQRQAGIPQMQLRQWYADAFVQDSFQLTRNTTVKRRSLRGTFICCTVQWEKEPPPPTFWMHQLGLVKSAPQLDEETFTAKLKAMVGDLKGQAATRLQGR